MALDVRAKRIYDPPEDTDGYRVLIDHDPTRFAEFRAGYRLEFAAPSERLGDLRRHAKPGPLTILYAARDQEHNNAVVLTELLRDG
jgi:uncharacterized protein YeaO (DUF488 family)